MPSTSKSQQRLMGMAYSLKKGDMDPKDASQEVKDLADSMTLKQLKDFAETSHAGLPDKVEESFEAGKTYTWTGVEWDPKRKNNYKVSKNIEIVKVKPNGDLVGRFEGESSEFIVRQPEKTLKKIKENITIGGMGDVQLPTETEFGSGDVPAGRKNIKKKMKLKNKIATFEQFLVESLKAKESVANNTICEATVQMDAMDPDNKDFLKFLKKHKVEIIDKKMEGPGGSQPVITMQGKRKDLEAVLADEELGWADADLAEYIEESVVNESSQFLFSFDYNTDEDDVDYIQSLLKEAGVDAVAQPGLDSEEMVVKAKNAVELRKAKKTIKANGFEIYESVVNEAFYRLPKDVIGTELYVANKNLQSFYSNVSTGNDVDPKVLDAIIKNLQQVKSLTKKFNKAEEITGTVYEGAGKPAGLTKDETLKVAQKFADAAASVDPKKGKWTVNKKTLEEDSFNLDINGELGEGGSYNVYQNGDVINMALRENPIIGKKDDDAKTIANGFKKMMNESVNEATLINRENVSSAQTIAAKSKLSYEDSWDAIVSYLVATMGLPKALDLVLKLEKEYKKIFESVFQTLKENKDIKTGDIVSKKYASTEEDYTRTFKVISITGTKANLQDVKTGKKVEIFLNDLIKESVDVNEARSINKIQKDWAKVTADMKDTVDEWKSAEGDNKTKLLDQLKSLTARKKQLEAELNDAVSGKDADLELVVKESLSESKMSDIDLLAQEAKDFKDFVKEFKKDYKHMDTGNPKDLEAWLKGVYDAAMEDMDESKN